jgi:uncharacterized membrane protein
MQLTVRTLYSLPTVRLSSLEAPEKPHAPPDLGLIFHGGGASLATMKQGQIHDHCRQDRRRSVGVFLVAAISLFFVLALTSEVWARSSGGRYGGRSGFSRSRSGSSGGWSGTPSAPSTPYRGPTSPGYVPPMGGTGFGFLPFLLPFLGGWGIGAGGGSGFGGLFSILIILGIVVLVGKVLLQNLATARRNRLDQAPTSPLGGDRYAVVKCQLALLSTARELQRDLRQYALAATTDTVAGLAASLQEIAIALARQQNYWRYGVIQVEHTGTLDDAERVFNRVVSQERAKLSEELTVNVEGVRRQAPMPDTSTSEEVGRYLVVTLIVATGYPEFLTNQTPTLKDFEATLQRLGTLLAADMLALEVMWSPENPGDTLTEDELIAEYPELSPL